MTALPGKTYGKLNAWPDPVTPGRWRYLPLAPEPQRGPDGRAQVTAIEAGDMLMLTVGASLSVSDAERAAAQSAIAAASGAKASEVELRPADATISGAALTFTTDSAAPVELATARPSPQAPYPAAFSAMLNGERAKQANAALKGGTGRLGVRYDLTLAQSRSATARLCGDAAGSDIEAAITAGALTLTLTADEGASKALRDDVRRRVVEQARDQLARLDVPDATARLEIEATRDEPAPLVLSLEASIGDWLRT